MHVKVASRSLTGAKDKSESHSRWHICAGCQLLDSKYYFSVLELDTLNVAYSILLCIFVVSALTCPHFYHINFEKIKSPKTLLSKVFHYVLCCNCRDLTVIEVDFTDISTNQSLLCIPERPLMTANHQCQEAGHLNLCVPLQNSMLAVYCHPAAYSLQHNSTSKYEFANTSGNTRRHLRLTLVL